MSEHISPIDDQFAQIVAGLDMVSDSDELFALTPSATVAVNLPDHLRGFVVAYAYVVADSPHHRDSSSWFDDPEAAILDAATTGSGDRLSDELGATMTEAARTVLETVHLDELTLEQAEAWMRVINAWRLNVLAHQPARTLDELHADERLGLPMQVASVLVSCLAETLP